MPGSSSEWVRYEDYVDLKKKHEAVVKQLHALESETRPYD